jgi:hypothetical protein
MTALAKQADLDIPFTEEVAADIFMGAFTTKWREAAAIASTVMAGTLYARYYDLPDASTWAPVADDARGLIDRVRVRWGVRTAEDFAHVCGERSREAASGAGGFVARNGAIIEQSQILTTHNLAPLVDRLGLVDSLRPRAKDLTEATLAWIVRQQTTRYDSWHSQLQMLKNTAYAWRQAIFFLSLVDPPGQRAAVAGLRSSVERQPDDWQRRFDPVVAGLQSVIEGAAFDSTGKLAGGRRFLGWSVGRHWLLT